MGLQPRPGTLIGGQLRRGGASLELENPYSGERIALIDGATAAEADEALAVASSTRTAMAELSAADRAALLEAGADAVGAASQELVELIVAEQGKTVTEATAEVTRTPTLLRLCAEEARRISGEVLPLDASAAPDGRDKLGFTLRIPAGVTVAITPFNYPLLLVVHKVGPALAAGNPVILKPASATPLVGLRLAELVLGVGWPEGALQCLVGSGAELGGALYGDERVRVVTFTGSRGVGDQIARAAGPKILSLELGANCPTVVMPDADPEQVAASLAIGGYANAGQVCISAQRALVSESLYSEVLDALTERVGSISVGDPADPATTMGPLISAGEAERVAASVQEAVAKGARVTTGGERDRAIYQPTVVADVSPEATLFREELFGPAVALTPFSDLEQAIEWTNSDGWGLGAAIFTQDLDLAVSFARAAEAGNVHVNNSPLWRADTMPYGGLNGSGIGKEGPRFAIETMTESKTVVLHTRPPQT